jgi:hypothetical protein
MLEGYEDYDHVLLKSWKKDGSIIKIYRVKPMQFCFYAEINYFSRIETSPPMKSVAGCEAWIEENSV